MQHPDDTAENHLFANSEGEGDGSCHPRVTTREHNHGCDKWDNERGFKGWVIHPLNRRSFEMSRFSNGSRIRNMKMHKRNTPITRSKAPPISIINAMPNVVVRAARKIPFSKTRR